jgi:hypothetical protein
VSVTKSWSGTSRIHGADTQRSLSAYRSKW